MNCAEFENLVVAMARDELMETEAHRQGLVHAGTCARCARRLANERMLNDTVAAAVKEDSGKQAPPCVGKMLMETLREQKLASQRRRRIWVLRGVSAAVAAMLLIGSGILLRRSWETPAMRGHAAVSVDTEAAGAAETGEEVVTDFIPLDDGPAPTGATSVVRVQLPREALTAFGLPVNEDRTEDLVQADLLLDEDGLTRAVRFVE